jgi:catechol 2,3-dioxygenase-like lactoylglutathione lyase family enzyme
VLRRLHPSSTGPGAQAGIPILPSADLARTAEFYAAVGFTETGRYESYLLLNRDGVEIHFALEDSPAPGQCFLFMGDALTVWKQLRHDGASGVGPIADQDYGLREFVLTDPDGNRVRFGSPLDKRRS